MAQQMTTAKLKLNPFNKENAAAWLPINKSCGIFDLHEPKKKLTVIPSDDKLKLEYFFWWLLTSISVLFFFLHTLICLINFVLSSSQYSSTWVICPVTLWVRLSVPVPIDPWRDKAVGGQRIQSDRLSHTHSNDRQMITFSMSFSLSQTDTEWSVLSNKRVEKH